MFGLGYYYWAGCLGGRDDGLMFLGACFRCNPHHVAKSIAELGKTKERFVLQLISASWLFQDILAIYAGFIVGHRDERDTLHVA